MVVYSEGELEEWRKTRLEPHVAESQKIGIDAIKSDNITDFVLAVSQLAQDTETYIDLGCTFAENMMVGVKCTKEAKKLRANAINKLSEALAEKCGGNLRYVVMD